MKRLKFLSVFFFLAALAACGPMLRISNSGQQSFRDFGFTKYVIDFDGVEFDVLDLDPGMSTPGMNVKTGNSHAVKEIWRYFGDEEDQYFVTTGQPVNEFEMKGGNYYTLNVYPDTPGLFDIVQE